MPLVANKKERRIVALPVQTRVWPLSRRQRCRVVLSPHALSRSPFMRFETRKAASQLVSTFDLIRGRGSRHGARPAQPPACEVKMPFGNEEEMLDQITAEAQVAAAQPEGYAGPCGLPQKNLRRKIPSLLCDSGFDGFDSRRTLEGLTRRTFYFKHKR